MRTLLKWVCILKDNLGFVCEQVKDNKTRIVDDESQVIHQHTRIQQIDIYIDCYNKDLHLMKMTLNNMSNTEHQWKFTIHTPSSTCEIQNPSKTAIEGWKYNLYIGKIP